MGQKFSSEFLETQAAKQEARNVYVVLNSNAAATAGNWSLVFRALAVLVRLAVMNSNRTP